MSKQGGHNNSDNQRKRDQKFDIKELEKEQKRQLESEQQRYDHKLIDEKSQDFLKAAKQKRKSHRTNTQHKDLDEESDVDEEFKIGFEDAASKFAVKRKKKYMFTDTGMPIEPFNLDNDIREGVITRDGVMRMERDKNKDDQDSDDPWLESIKEDQDKMLYQQCQNQKDSDDSESEQEEGHGGGDDEDLSDEQELISEDQKKRNKLEIEDLKKLLLKYLDKETNENANMAMKRLKAENQKQSQPLANKKKNVRKLALQQQQLKQQQNQQNPNQGSQSPSASQNNDPITNPQDLNQDELLSFDKLLALCTKLQDLGYVDVFSIRQQKLSEEIEKLEQYYQKEKDNFERVQNGWFYKIMYQETGQESEIFGPFTRDEMQSWRELNYFDETEQQICAFIKSLDKQKNNDNWLFISDIPRFN
ncbi:UNKNOWN [Stylonychia lemnae]|uniref:GYF domain-containing protein n=1 Tax=Stylonychia lemnae TaxID=5949 RepID=A0A077ZRX2_STYLE|nr:UNKNOWN [Stylonychia lemnae]|eukprot:CDW72658.1 UNKNOWN [Stylonychia lemnae]